MANLAWRAGLFAALISASIVAAQAQNKGQGAKTTAGGDIIRDWQTDFRRSVFSGNEARLFEFGWVRYDCTGPIADIRIVKPPSHGEVRFEEAISVISLVKGSSILEERCNGKPLDVVRLFYKSQERFVGPDEVVLDVDTKMGKVRRYTFAIDVR
jgi:hypothetical protein